MISFQWFLFGDRSREISTILKSLQDSVKGEWLLVWYENYTNPEENNLKFWKPTISYRVTVKYSPTQFKLDCLRQIVSFQTLRKQFVDPKKELLTHRLDSCHCT